LSKLLAKFTYLFLIFILNEKLVRGHQEFRKENPADN